MKIAGVGCDAIEIPGGAGLRPADMDRRSVLPAPAMAGELGHHYAWYDI